MNSPVDKPHKKCFNSHSSRGGNLPEWNACLYILAVYFINFLFYYFSLLAQFENIYHNFTIKINVNFLKMVDVQHTVFITQDLCPGRTFKQKSRGTIVRELTGAISVSFCIIDGFIVFYFIWNLKVL